MTEKRQSPRASMSVRMQYRCVPRGILVWQITTLRNLGYSDAMFVSSYEFSVGQELELQIRLPQTDTSVPVVARVKWCKRVAGRTYNVGVLFHSSDPDLLAAIRETVQGRQGTR